MLFGNISEVFRWEVSWFVFTLLFTLVVLNTIPCLKEWVHVLALPCHCAEWPHPPTRRAPLPLQLRDRVTSACQVHTPHGVMSLAHATEHDDMYWCPVVCVWHVCVREGLPLYWDLGVGAQPPWPHTDGTPATYCVFICCIEGAIVAHMEEHYVHRDSSHGSQMYRQRGGYCLQ